MTRLVIYLVLVVSASVGLSWLADRPGSLEIVWEGYQLETSVFRAVVLFLAFLAALLVVWSLIRQILQSPAAVERFFSARRVKKGFDALSSGMIAVGAADAAMAARYAQLARKSLPNEPLTHLLRAQAAQLVGDRATARRIYEAMLSTPDTEQLGLRGLFAEAERDGDHDAARRLANRALQINPKLAWPVEALFDLQCRTGDWSGALETLHIGQRAQNVSRIAADRRRAVLLAAQAKKLEESEPDRALTLALESAALAPDLVPSAVIAGRMLAARGNTARASRVIEKTWMRAPHPDLAYAYAYARAGDSPHDRLERVRRLASLAPHSIESPVALATAAIEARAFDDARHALAPFLDGGNATQRFCLLMARIEGEQHGDKGRVREWLARAVGAPRDPAWTTDGVVADEWAPISPVTGAFDAFQWRTPVESADPATSAKVAEKLEELINLGAAEAEPPPIVVSESGLSGGSGGEPALAVTDANSAALPPAENAAVSLPDAAKKRAIALSPAAESSAKPDAPAATERAAADSLQTHAETSKAVSAPPARNGPIDGKPHSETTSKAATNGSETPIYFSSRPPDDPGPGEIEFDEERPPESPFRSSRLL